MIWNFRKILKPISDGFLSFLWNFLAHWMSFDAGFLLMFLECFWCLGITKNKRETLSKFHQVANINLMLKLGVVGHFRHDFGVNLRMVILIIFLMFKLDFQAYLLPWLRYKLDFVIDINTSSCNVRLFCSFYQSNSHISKCCLLPAIYPKHVHWHCNHVTIYQFSTEYGFKNQDEVRLPIMSLTVVSLTIPCLLSYGSHICGY